MFTVSSDICRITWVRTQGVWHMTPCMNQQMILYLSFWEILRWVKIFLSWCSGDDAITPDTLVKYAAIKAYVDANHTGKMTNRRSHSGIIIYVNIEPIIWYSKRQKIFEASNFGSEFVAISISTEMIEDLRYKWRCFGIPVEGPAEVFCDSMSVVKNSSILTSSLNKRYNAICYHRVSKAKAAGILRVGSIPGEFNLADMFTKTTVPGNSRHNLVDSILPNTTSPIGDIEKAYFHLYMGASKYLTHYKSSRGKWILGLHIYILFKSIIYCYQFAGTR